MSAATRERVLAAARELDYRPSAAARSLKSRRTGGLGLVVPDVTDPFAAELVAGVLDCARSLGEHVLLDASHGDPEREAAIVERLMEQRVDAVIAVPSGDPGPWLAATRTGVSVVFADRALPELPKVPAVLTDDASGVRSLVEYLVGLGHRRVAFLGAAGPGRAADARERAFRATLATARVPVDEELVVAARPERDSAYAAAAGLLQARGDVTAVLAAGHLAGEAAVLVARELDLRVPADVSIAMIDDVAWAELCDPPLTAVARPGHGVGYRACETALREASRRTAAPVLLPTELVIRASCRPPRGRSTR